MRKEFIADEVDLVSEGRLVIFTASPDPQAPDACRWLRPLSFLSEAIGPARR